MEFALEELRAAWARVEENAGCAGADGVTVERFAARLDSELSDLAERVRTERYRPLPLLKILVEKKPGRPETRRLLVPAVTDRVAQTAAARRLMPWLEDQFLESSFAYRPGRGVDSAVKRVRQLEELGFEKVVDADIRTYFDEVGHSLLLGRLTAAGVEPGLLPLLCQWIRAEVWDGQRVVRLEKGLPQGSPLSPMLANFFLEPLDEAVERSGGHLVRYADDFLILCQTKEAAEGALAETEGLLRELGLAANHEKTRLTSFDEGFTFLGVYFIGNRAYIPWKRERPAGRPVFVARPMPAWILQRYRQPARVTNVAEALRRGGVRFVATAAVAAGQKGVEMAFLYITEQGAVVRKSEDRILIEKDDRVLLDRPYHKLEAILLFGNVQVTTQAMGELMEKGIRLSLLSRGGRLRGVVAPVAGKDVELRMRQFELFRDGERCLALARECVQAKAGNGLVVLRQYQRRTDQAGGGGWAESIPETISHMGQAGDLSQLMGCEGSAARAYFEGLMSFNRSGFAWTGRAQHPSPDPLNALLSLVYMLILQELMGEMEGLGLDPYLGFLHQTEYGRPSLALDLLEAFRHPLADRLVLEVGNRRLFAESEFERRDDGGVRLKADGLRRMLEWYEQWMTKSRKGQPSWRARLRNEVEEFRRFLRDGSPFSPFVYGDPEEEEAGCDTLSVTI